ncbi:MAG: Asp-tRNA(Asn)/Glu-tRNA(Gln) amidotransferase subunit GatA [Patescibacteria group bacterium]
MNLNELTITKARTGLDRKEFSSVELTTTCLDRIKKRNQEINAFITVTEELAMEEAKKADELIAKKKQQPLTGIPYGVKDAICVKGVRSTGGARILDNYAPPFDATVIAKIRAQGAVLLGKQNCDAFGHGASNENSMYGPVKNPHDLSKVAGGSSGGSAAAVADHMCLFSIAEDTGGSIRLPSAFCGIVGLRPSYGRNSRYGIMPMASSLDTVGPMGKTVEDVALLQEIMQGRDVRDATTVEGAKLKKIKQNYTKLDKIKIGIPREYFELEGLDKEVREIIETKIKRLVLSEAEGLKDQKIEVIDVSLPHTKYAIAVYYIIVPAEDSSNLGRLDGLRYGVLTEHKNLYEAYAKSRAQGFPEEVKRRIMIGTYALSAGYYDAYYRKAQRVRTLIKQDFERAFEQVDVLVTPTAPYPAFGLGEKRDDILEMYLADVFEVPASVAGVPAISVPAGKTKAGLPVGLQVIGPRMGEEIILQVGQSI